jgi:hypothetical protein
MFDHLYMQVKGRDHTHSLICRCNKLKTIMNMRQFVIEIKDMCSSITVKWEEYVFSLS